MYTEKTEQYFIHSTPFDGSCEYVIFASGPFSPLLGQGEQLSDRTNITTLYMAHNEAKRQAFNVISSQVHFDALCEMPPERRESYGNVSAFSWLEHDSGNLTRWYCCIDREHYVMFLDDCDAPIQNIAKRASEGLREALCEA